MRVLWPNQQPVARAGKRWRAAVSTSSGTRVDTRETGKDLIGVLLGPPKTYCDIFKKSYCVLDPIGMFSNDGTL